MCREAPDLSFFPGSLLCEGLVDWVELWYEGVLWAKEECRLGAFRLRYYFHCVHEQDVL